MFKYSKHIEAIKELRELKKKTGNTVKLSEGCLEFMHKHYSIYLGYTYCPHCAELIGTPE